MKRLFGFVLLVLPIYAIGQNVVFNPGFDMTPWDTGWTIETDTAIRSNCPTKVAIAQAIPDTGKSLPNSCHLSSYVELAASGYCQGEAYAETKVYQIFNEIPSCSVKAQIKYLLNPWSLWCYKIDSIAIDVQTNGIWQTIWGVEWETDITWHEVSIGVNNPMTGIMFRTKSFIDCGSLTGSDYASYNFWVDDVYVGEAGVEESGSKVKTGELRAFPNPFVKFTKIAIPNPEDRVRIYDMSGRLIENTEKTIIGDDLLPGFYFVKLKGYKPIKIIKIGGVK